MLTINQIYRTLKLEENKKILSAFAEGIMFGEKNMIKNRYHSPYPSIESTKGKLEELERMSEEREKEEYER
jgi:hypothetical protein